MQFNYHTGLFLPEYVPCHRSEDKPPLTRLTSLIGAGVISRPCSTLALVGAVDGRRTRNDATHPAGYPRWSAETVLCAGSALIRPWESPGAGTSSPNTASGQTFHCPLRARLRRALLPERLKLSPKVFPRSPFLASSLMKKKSSGLPTAVRQLVLSLPTRPGNLRREQCPHLHSLFREPPYKSRGHPRE